MSRNAFIVFVSIFFYITSPPRGVESAKLPIDKTAPISILDAMTNDEGLCASGKPFGQSRYAKICKNFEYPKDNVTLNLSNYEKFMCIGIYDRIYRLCHLDTLKKTKISVIPENSLEFDEKVEKSFPKNGDDIFHFCKTWKNDYPPKYNKTEHFVNQLEKLIKKPALCVKYCTADNDSVVPLCVVLATMDNMSESIANGAQTVDVTSSKKGANNAQESTLQTKQSQDAVENDPKSVASDLEKSKDVNANFETTIEVAQSEKSIESQRTAEDSMNNVKSVQKISHVSSVTQTKKLDVDTQVSGAHVPDAASETKIKASDNKNDKKADHTATSGLAANNEASKGSKEIDTPADKAVIAQPADGDAIAKPADVAAIASPTADAATVSDAALEPNDNGGGFGQHDFGDDISGEDIGGVIDTAKLGSISQHTQDDPENEFGGADGINPAAVESPALSDVDPDQSAVEPSEKREYIPHMPSPNEEESHFFGYFTVISVMCIAGYVGYHNKQKILAMVLEGRRSRGGRNRRRPSTANYRKLDCTLEEAVTSQCNTNVTHVIY